MRSAGAVLLALVASLTSAAQLAVTQNNAAAGSTWKLEVIPGAVNCPGSVPVYRSLSPSDPGPTVSGEFKACSTITAEGVEVPNPQYADFFAGDQIVLKDGFRVSAGAEFTAVVGPASGLESPFAYVVSNHPKSESSYSASFWLNLDSLALGSGEEVEHFNGYSGDGEVQFKVILKRVGGENRLYVEAFEGGVRIATTEGVNETLLPSGWNEIEVNWQSGSGSGFLQVAVNGGSPFSLGSLANPSARIDSVRWGAVGAVNGDIDSTTGKLLLDEFASWR